MERKSFTIRAALMLGALVLGSVDVAAAATDRVKIGVGSTYPTYAIFAAAEELGYYAAQNLDVDVQTFHGAGAAQDALAAGSIDLCPVVPMAAERAIAQGARERIVAMFAPARVVGWYVMVPASSPIMTMADLNGKTVGVAQIGSPADLWVQRLARSAGVTVTTVPLDTGAAAALMAKRVDAAVMWPPASYENLIAGDVRALMDFEPALAPTITEGIAASEELIDKRPDVLRRWLSATSKAVRYMQDNEDWSEGFLKRYLGEDDSQAVALIYQNVIMKIDAGGAMHRDWMATSLQLGMQPGTVKGPLQSAVFLTASAPNRGR